MSQEGGFPLHSSADDDSFPFYRLETGRRKYQQRRLKPQTESLNKEVASSPEKFGRPTGRRKKKFVGVRQRSSGRWVAEIKDTNQKIRLWLGTFDTAEDAARAYDEAACLLRGMNTRTNFMPSASSNRSVLPSKAARTLIQRLNRTSAAKKEDQNQIRSSPAAYANQFQGSEYLQKDEEQSLVKAEPLHVQSFTTLLSSPYSRYDEGTNALQSLEEESPFVGRADETMSTFSGWDTGFSSMDFDEQAFSLAGYLTEGVKDESPGNSNDLSDALSGLEDLIHSGESLLDFSMPSCKFDELSAIEGLSDYDLAEMEVTAETEESMILREQIRRLNFERISSASLYAMNGVQELCLLRSGESRNGGSPLCLASPSFGRSPSFRGLLPAFAQPCKMLSSPGWLPRHSSSGSSPAAHKSSEHPNQYAAWGGHLCRVA